MVRAGLGKAAPRLPRCLLKRPVETEQSPCKAGVKLALVIPAYKTFWEFGFAFSLSRVLKMVTDRTGPQHFLHSGGRWHLSVELRKVSSPVPDGPMELGVSELFSAPSWFFDLVNKPET